MVPFFWVKRISFDENEATGIINVVNKRQGLPAVSVAYALDGTRVSDSYKGIVIVNGRKTLHH